MKVLRFELSSPPPSLNNSKIPTRRGKKIIMVSSPEYLAWQEKSKIELLSQRGRLPDPCYWSSHILIPASKTKADLDNLPKALHDLLVKSGRVPDDRYKVSVRAQFWSGDHVVVAVKQEDFDKWSIIKRASKATIQAMSRV